MNDEVFAEFRSDWIKRFAYRIMLCRNGLDTRSAMLIAENQFGLSKDQDPEDAAERYSGMPTVTTDRRRSPETGRIFGSSKMQGLSDMAFAHAGPSTTVSITSASEHP